MENKYKREDNWNKATVRGMLAYVVVSLLGNDQHSCDNRPNCYSLYLTYPDKPLINPLLHKQDGKASGTDREVQWKEVDESKYLLNLLTRTRN